VEFREGAEVTGIEVDHGRVVAVRAAGDRIETATVVNAAGAWGARIGALAGLRLPIAPLRRHIFVTAPVPGLEGDFPRSSPSSSAARCRASM
ncbi:MAG: FAD-dependent oxidoreductase, partial [Candidatus Velthaea sp.]